MKISKYECSFPGAFWVTVADDENLLTILNHFKFKKITQYFDVDNDEIVEELTKGSKIAVAGCYPVEHRRTGELGVLCIVYNLEEAGCKNIAHEAVHIADYYYQNGGIYTEDFTDGNEAYAYLVGWAAGNIFKTILDYERTKAKTE